MAKGFGAIVLTGGASNALDALPTADLDDGDICTVVTGSGAYHYTFDASSGASESSPYVIAPDDVGAGDGRWLLVTPQAPFSHVGAYRDSTSQSIPNDTETTLIFNAEIEDVLSEYNTTTGVFTPTYDGIYLVNAHAISDSVTWSSGEFSRLRLIVDSTVTVSGEKHWMPTGTNRTAPTITAQIKLSAGEALEIKITQDRGASLNFIAASTNTYMRIDRIA